ncbi:MAG: cyclic lactone autoinducer peptide [Lachnospiraceae bacterium]|nr:cyclic lactone autoinducer peptide [Lachnospiraceae bacterium]
MKKLYLRFGSFVATLALIAASMNVNATCQYHLYQETIPESAKKLCKVK